MTIKCSSLTPEACIDKSSSAELSEAINSMYNWYYHASLCLVFLSDVPTPEDDTMSMDWISKFNRSRWLTRGWTLQELLAPKSLQFYSKDWKLIPTEQGDWSLMQEISRRTGIPAKAIQGFEPSRWSIAQRMSWAGTRQTTRLEDRAYSLLGIFDVVMPLLYGEGKRAFQRLQEEILKTTNDHSIFCWKAEHTAPSFCTWRGLLARSPSEFKHVGDIRELFLFDNPDQPVQLTSKGLQMQVYLRPFKALGTTWEPESREFLALFNCFRADSRNNCGIWIRRIHDDVYVRVKSHMLAEVNIKKIQDEIFKYEYSHISVKPNLKNTKWRKCDICPRILGYHFLTDFLDSRTVLEIFPDNIYDSYAALFPFNMDSPSLEVPEARCKVKLASGCNIEITVRFDPRESFGSGSIESSAKSEMCNWIRSQCCEWKISGSSCDRHEMIVSSWIELNNEDNAIICVELIESESRHNDKENDLVRMSAMNYLASGPISEDFPRQNTSIPALILFEAPSLPAVLDAELVQHMQPFVPPYSSKDTASSLSDISILHQSSTSK